MHFEAIGIPGHSAESHSSAQVGPDLYLISWADLAVKKVENLLAGLEKVQVEVMATLGKERKWHSSVNFED